jgi:hypothetical protein
VEKILKNVGFEPTFDVEVVRFDKIAWSDFGLPKAGPEGTSPMNGVSNPTTPAIFRAAHAVEKILKCRIRTYV